MKNFLVSFCGCALLVAACVTQAKATTYNLTFVGGQNCITGTCVGGYTGNLTIGATPIAGSPGMYNITSVTGTTGGYNIDGLIGTTPGYAGNDNIFLTTGTTFVDFNGVSYYLKEGAVDVPFNVYADADTQGIYDFAAGSLSNPSAQGVISNITVSPLATTIPEPSSLVLLGTGALGLVGSIRRRFSR